MPGIREQLLHCLIVPARRHQSALWAAPAQYEITLQVDRGVLELLESFALQQLPHLLLRDIVSLFQQFLLIIIEDGYRRFGSSSLSTALADHGIQ